MKKKLLSLTLFTSLYFCLLSFGQTPLFSQTDETTNESPIQETDQTTDQATDQTTENAEETTGDKTGDKTKETTGDETTGNKTGENTEDSTGDKTGNETGENTEETTGDKTGNKTPISENIPAVTSTPTSNLKIPASARTDKFPVAGIDTLILKGNIIINLAVGKSESLFYFLYE